MDLEFFTGEREKGTFFPGRDTRGALLWKSSPRQNFNTRGIFKRFRYSFPWNEGTSPPELHNDSALLRRWNISFGLSFREYYTLCFCWIMHKMCVQDETNACKGKVWSKNIFCSSVTFVALGIFQVIIMKTYLEWGEKCWKWTNIFIKIPRLKSVIPLRTMNPYIHSVNAWSAENADTRSVSIMRKWGWRVSARGLCQSFQSSCSKG